MEKNIFIYQQLINPSFFQRLFRQYPEENVVIEINNTLATQPILDISVEDLKLITDQIPIDVYSVYQLNFIEFYAVYLNNCVKNYKITDLQFSELLHLQNIFNLDPSITKKIHTEIVGKLYRQEYDKAIKSKKITPEDKFRIEEIRYNLRLSEFESNKIKYEAKIALLKPYFRELLNCETISPVDEEELNSILKNLELKLPDDISSEIIRRKKYWTWKFGQINKVAIFHNLQKDEFCYFETQSKWYEFLVRSNYDKIDRWNLNFDIPIINSEFKPRNVLDLKLPDYGKLYLTNKRIVFVGSLNHNLKFEQIQSIGIYSNGVEIIKWKGRNIFIQISEDSEKFAVYISRMYKSANQRML